VIGAIGRSVELPNDSAQQIRAAAVDRGAPACCTGFPARLVMASEDRGNACPTLAVGVLCRARLRGRMRTADGSYFIMSNPFRAHVLMLVTARAPGPERDAADRHDAKSFVRREYHHDTCMRGCAWITTTFIAVRATLRPRWCEQTKEILTRISW
jgi:hypothetical protein